MYLHAKAQHLSLSLNHSQGNLILNLLELPLLTIDKTSIIEILVIRNLVSFRIDFFIALIEISVISEITLPCWLYLQKKRNYS